LKSTFYPAVRSVKQQGSAESIFWLHRRHCVLKTLILIITLKVPKPYTVIIATF